MPTPSHPRAPPPSAEEDPSRRNHAASNVLAPSSGGGSAAAAWSPSRPSFSAYSSSPFTTTSDVLKHLNAALSELSWADAAEDEEGYQMDKDSERSREPLRRHRKEVTGGEGPCFELQKRFEDGSTRPATESEVRASDLDAKVKQVAHHLSQLGTEEERAHFVESQVLYANNLYAEGKLEEAVDAYVTCLAGIDPNKQPELLARVLNNLAQSALKLRWYRRCVRVCGIALEQLRLEAPPEEKEGEEDGVRAEAPMPPAQPALRGYAAKLHFKRAKAQRLLGLYLEARRDLDRAAMWLADADCEAGGDSNSVERRAVVAERAFLARAVQQGARHREQQRRGMQQLLGSGGAATGGLSPPSSSSFSKNGTVDACGSTITLDGCSNSNSNSRVESEGGSTARTPRKAPLYRDAVPTPNYARSFSALRAPSGSEPQDRCTRPPAHSPGENEGEGGGCEEGDDGSCWQRVVGLARWALLAVLPPGHGTVAPGPPPGAAASVLPRRRKGD